MRDIGRYLLHKDRISDDKDAILRNYKDALKFLQMVADGTFSLGAEDPIAKQSHVGRCSPRLPTRTYSIASS
ncbi:phage protein Gp36 family protein [Pseudomonas aeruginosa]|uniref:phage protein Gp36 family protein n=1 Tax=Pseudomonas aeruginosa TaxID=287 RepID=UPI0028E82A5E|nr:phage protein Gp36 family protein [Pseudomonas aeruginosa]WNP66694.1 phage protein Gp36 family protein [Pseudomonas aeruginosa]